MAVLVDANMIIDVATVDRAWSVWSAAALERAGREGRLVINPIVYAEVSVAYERIEALEAVLPESVFGREAIPWPAAFLAGKAFVAYAAAAVHGARPCRTSSSAPTPQSAAIAC